MRAVGAGRAVPRAPKKAGPRPERTKMGAGRSELAAQFPAPLEAGLRPSFPPSGAAGNPPRRGAGNCALSCHRPAGNTQRGAR